MLHSRSSCLLLWLWLVRLQRLDVWYRRSWDGGVIVFFSERRAGGVVTDSGMMDGDEDVIEEDAEDCTDWRNEQRNPTVTVEHLAAL
jgi:hypothetical protein